MGSNIHALAAIEGHRPHVIEEDERPDHPVTRDREDPADGEAAEITGPRVDDQEHVRIRCHLGFRLEAWQCSRILLERHGLPPGESYDANEEAGPWPMSSI